MSLDLGAGAYDVVISLEVLSHVADQPAFIGKLASLLREGGLLMLATQNRPALEPLNLAPPKPGQLRRWVDRQELSALLAPEFELQELFSVTPVNVQVRKLRRLASYIPGAGVELLKVGGRGGWTLMALARKRGGQRDAG
jgi:SAM-dependent methyltransferase